MITKIQPTGIGPRLGITDVIVNVYHDDRPKEIGLKIKVRDLSLASKAEERKAIIDALRSHGEVSEHVEYDGRMV